MHNPSSAFRQKRSRRRKTLISKICSGVPNPTALRPITWSGRWAQPEKLTLNLLTQISRRQCRGTSLLRPQSSSSTLTTLGCSEISSGYTGGRARVSPRRETSLTSSFRFQCAVPTPSSRGAPSRTSRPTLASSAPCSRERSGSTRRTGPARSSSTRSSRSSTATRPCGGSHPS